MRIVPISATLLRGITETLRADLVTVESGQETVTEAFYHQPVFANRSLSDLYATLAAITDCSATAPGAALIRLGTDFFSLPKEARAAVCTALCASLGRPIRVFKRWDLWRPLGVSLEAPPFRATGTGYIPFHIDIVNSEYPPDYVAFLCERADPLGGGETIVSNLLDAHEKLSRDDRAILADAKFREGEFYDLAGVGSELNPFPVFAREGRRLRVRFTAKMLPDIPDGPAKRALSRYNELLEHAQRVVNLTPGDLLVINQWVAAHGRLPLGLGQFDLTASERRLVFQSFIRRFDTE